MSIDAYIATLDRILADKPVPPSSEDISSRLEFMRDVRDWKAEVSEACPPSLIRILLDDRQRLLSALEAAQSDAQRYRAFFDAGLPITFLGVEYHDKPSLDAAIDAAIEAGREG